MRLGLVLNAFAEFHPAALAPRLCKLAASNPRVAHATPYLTSNTAERVIRGLKANALCSKLAVSWDGVVIGEVVLYHQGLLVPGDVPDAIANATGIECWLGDPALRNGAPRPLLADHLLPAILEWVARNSITGPLWAIPVTDHAHTIAALRQNGFTERGRPMTTGRYKTCKRQAMVRG